MIDYFTSLLSFFFSEENQLISMFLSAFLSATVLPGNSELIFTALASKNLLAEQTIFSASMMWLALIATLGNSLGSIVTYAMGLLIPKPVNLQHRSARLALSLCEKYGVFALLLTSLPVIGDVLCGIAGWLRFNIWQAVLFITLGKLARYLLLLFTLYPFMF
ncbi:YqaA family protein [Actinobacillus suis]|nr:YqaA family protein [Actinobacillus suis]MCO4167350.1 DedA family protein [Actinobacillus suis]MCO4168996.1 DedA family protein [Actinobacillus suis]MCQ9629679.1 DedA family protein [Actinobacillus suis]MCQ9631935.1 DedA family protein [Actinobacillus suis]MCQ9711560.1 DedA family protein [Actinobacillus suis]